MPQTTPERAARWPGGDSEAIDHMKAAGYKLTRSWTWVRPNPDHVPTERERDAAQYLIEEWDFDGIEAAPQSVHPCSLGVGCDETGICYAMAHNQPDQCGRS